MEPSDPSVSVCGAGAFREVAPGLAPVFACAEEGRTVFYAPRLACVMPARIVPATEQRVAALLRESPPAAPGDAADDEAGRAAGRLAAAARQAESQAAAAARAGFEPECLTLFLNNACNLKCRYCHAAPGAVPDRPISEAALRAAARLAAGSCARRQRLLTLAFHGGGEPSLDEAEVDRFLGIVREEAGRSAVALRTYIATNGAMPESRARWLASRFDLVGLSCDGPPDIQDRQRPARDGSPTSALVERTGAVLRDVGTAYLVRATITPATVGRQPEIMAYILDRFAPAEVRLEPIYTNGADAGLLGGADAPGFVAGFMAARRAAGARRVPVTSSLALPGSLHGRYCNALRGVLNLAPNDVATGCFLESRLEAIDRRGVRLGALRPDSAAFELDGARIAAMLARAVQLPAACRGCPCVFQCSHGCPDFCAWDVPFDGAREAELLGSFRCRAARLLTEAVIRDAAAAAWAATAPGSSQDAWDPATKLRLAVYRAAEAGGSRP